MENTGPTYTPGENVRSKAVGQVRDPMNGFLPRGFRRLLLPGGSSGVAMRRSRIPEGASKFFAVD